MTSPSNPPAETARIGGDTGTATDTSSSSTSGGGRGGSKTGELQFNKSGRYQVLDTLGKGGMGVVYKALDLRLGRFVAIKRLVTDKELDPDLLEGFLREARVLAQLRHFNLPEIYDIDNDEQGPFISMEFISGATLMQQHKAAGKLDPRRLLEIGEQLCGALEVAHKRGIVHRDIKPSNILVTSDGVPKLIDFGIAAAGQDAAGNNLKSDNSVAGTKSYSSPEQLADATKADNRSDLYSLGATLYALISGDSPITFKDNLIPEPVRPMLRKAMAKPPADRFQSADEFRKSLRALLETAFDRPAGAKKGRTLAADERPLLERLDAEVRGHQDAGRFKEAIAVWQRIGKLTGDESAVAPRIQQCNARIRERESRRLLENLVRFVGQGKLDESDDVLKELFKTDPGNAEATVWQDNLRRKRSEFVKKLYYDAKGYLHDGRVDIAADNVRKALSQNRDPQMAPRLETLAAVCRTKLALAECDKALARGEKEEAFQHVTAAQEHLEKAAGLAKTDALFEEVRKKAASLVGAERATSEAVFIWLFLAAAAPGLASATAGAIFFGLGALIGGLVGAAVGAGAVYVVRGMWRKKDPRIAKLNGWIDAWTERQADNGLIMKVAFGLLGLMMVLMVAVGAMVKK